MRKTTVLAGVVVLAGAAYVACAWYVGKQAQVAIADAVSQANERAVSVLGSDLTSNRFRIEIRSYERGVFSSSAQYVVHSVDSDGQPLEYVLQDELQHGPFPLALLRSGELAPVLAYSQADMVVTPAVASWFDAGQGETPLNIQTRVGFGGNGHSHWTFAPFETSRDDQRVSFSGGYLRIDFKDGFNDNVARGHFDRYALIDNARDEKVEVRDISFDSTTQTVAQGYFLQDSTIGIKALTLSGAAGGSPVVIDGLSIDLSSSQKANMLDGQLSYDARRILVDGVDLGQMTLSGSMSELDIKALADIQTTYAAMAEERGPGTPPGFLLTQEEQIVLQNKLRPLLAAGPRFAVDPLVWKNASGESRASASIVMRDPGETSDANMFEVMRDLIERATMDVRIERSMVVALFQKASDDDGADPTQAGELGGLLFDEYAQALVEMGVARLDNGALVLSLDASPAGDTVVFNGETLSTDQFLMRLMWLVLLPM